LLTSLPCAVVTRRTLVNAEAHDWLHEHKSCVAIALSCYVTAFGAVLWASYTGKGCAVCVEMSAVALLDAGLFNVNLIRSLDVRLPLGLLHEEAWLAGHTVAIVSALEAVLRAALALRNVGVVVPQLAPLVEVLVLDLRSGIGAGRALADAGAVDAQTVGDDVGQVEVPRARGAVVCSALA
jgi:hypothetical protein